MFTFGDWILDNLGLIIIVSIVVGLILFTSSVKVMLDREEHLMRQCLEDGKKEYECRAYIRQGRGV